MADPTNSRVLSHKTESCIRHGIVPTTHATLLRPLITLPFTTLGGFASPSCLPFSVSSTSTDSRESRKVRNLLVEGQLYLSFDPASLPLMAVLNFHTITIAGPDKGAHYHELFLRGKRFLAHRIPRMKIKGQGPRKSAKPAHEPNFYSMTYLPPNGVPESRTKDLYHHLMQPQSTQSNLLPERSPQGVNSALERALVQQAYLNACASSLTTAPSLAGPSLLLSHPSRPSEPALSQALAFSNAVDSVRENELLTAILLERLRERT